MDHLVAFQAVGRFIGRALVDGQKLPLQLKEGEGCAKKMGEAMLGVSLSLDDVEHLDPVVLLYVLTTPDNVADLALTFSATECVSDGHVTEVDLIDHGRHVAVTNDNKHDYVQRMVRYLLFDRVETQLQAVLLGLHEIVPPELLLVFDHKEFGLHLCGLTDIDMGDWKTSTLTSSNLKGHDVLEVRDVVESLTRPDQAKLLQFSTGSSQDPIQGFKGLTSYDGKICYFTLKGTEYTPGRYPVIHACYNRIDLPLYPTMDLLKEALTMVLMMSDPTGFTME
ncbi:hypothetical protein H257_16686 [Aphanomyces astaci]|uniref:HECT-type E3 ubiquitin transferase n=1 Tax=Aphanomyces astaci TaxID=112090 RepID=W4FHQ7_APHAT|nr:hypothetical protein H257_16686 [Aphanomyces astaci]ETV66995.1 hypothetical protein H257_16686 [Aphanomyces astaci]|eukprot:XP_009843512.1 hypothetical protein H257_16686 [Aphanomyces astaci]